MNQFQSVRIAYIQASWHGDIVRQSYEGFVSGLDGKIAQSNVEVFAVPGSLEIPLQAQTLAKTGKYALIVAAGIIVDGGIYRHEFVAQSVLDGIMRVQLDQSVPILSVVLTPHNFQDTEEHRKFFFKHFRVKGGEAANACLKVLNNRLCLDEVA